MTELEQSQHFVRVGGKAPRITAALVVVIAMIGVGLLANVIPADSKPSSRPLVTSEVPVTAMNQGLGEASNSPVLVADPFDDRFVVMANRLDAPDFGCALQVSGNGGRSWLPAVPVSKLPAGADKCYAGEAAFDRHGVLHYLFVGLHGAGNEPMGAFLTTSKDRGRTFSSPRKVLGPRNFGIRMAIDRNSGARGRIHLVWLHATSDPPLGGFGPAPNPIQSAYSDDGGRTFSAPVQVSDRNRERVVAPALALGPDHAVHVGYYDLREDAVDYQGLEGPPWEGTWSIVVASSDDGGRRFGRGVVIDDKVKPSERVMLIFTMPPPALATDRDKRLCAAWTDARHGDADALLRCSPNAGRQWEGLRRLNDDRVGNGRSQYLPRLSIAPGGRIDVVFLDRRDDPENLTNHVYFTNSTDGGKSFARNVRLTRDASDSRIGQTYLNVSAEGQVEFGARLGLLSRGTEALAAWPDTRNSRPGTMSQDLFAATVSELPAPRDRTIPRLAGATIVAMAMLAVVVMRKQRRREPGVVAETES